jgi:hypothetical protein
MKRAVAKALPTKNIGKHSSASRLENGKSTTFAPFIRS